MGADHFDGLGAEELIERVADLLVAIVDQEAERPLIEVYDEVARLLGGPVSSRT
jgi:hypothetical protein